MKLIFHSLGKEIIAELDSEDQLINSLDDALDLMGNAFFQEAGSVVVRKENLCPEFFDLSSGIAGDILQKFSTYGMRMAIVGDYSDNPSKSLRDFIFESNKIGRVLFVGTLNEALTRFSA